MEVGKFYESSCFTIRIINENELVYFTDTSITRCSHAPFEDDKLTEISKDEYIHRLDKVMDKLVL